MFRPLLALACCVALLGCEGAITGDRLPSPSQPDAPTPPDDSEAALCSTATRELGRVTVRRLNRYEYNATVRDLLGDTTRPADAFPADDFGYGFDNNGDVLSSSPLLVEKLHAAAEKLITDALAKEFQPGATLRTEGEAATASTGVASGTAWNLYSNGTLTQRLDVPRDGAYTLRVRAWQQAAGPDAAKMAFLVDGAQLAQVDVVSTTGDTFTHAATLTAGSHVIGVEFLNDYYQAPDDRNLLVDWFELELPAQGAPGGTLLVCDPGTGTACVRTIVERFGRRAWRRPMSSAEVDRYAAIVALAQSEGEPVLAGLELSLQAVLVSPHFVFRVEPNDGQASRELSDYELAARLSYFLWGSMPDDELSALADTGTLRSQLEPQVRRMLADPRSEALVTQWAGSWLWSRAVEDTSPDPVLFPTMTPELKHALQQETEAFVRSFLQEDRDALDLLHSNDMFVSDVTAAHYGVPAPGSASMVRISSLPEGRGGVLGQAGLLTVTSQPNRTSPVKRGKWVLAQLLCTEPPPPPPNVEGLKPETMSAGSLRAQMEAHRADPACAGCHQLMDPIGFGLENFDGIGRWRLKDSNGFDIDASGALPDGRPFAGPTELAGLLKSDERFPRCVTQQLFTYALGHAPEAEEQCTVYDLSQTFKAKGHRLSDLIVALVQSDAFTHRRAEAP